MPNFQLLVSKLKQKKVIYSALLFLVATVLVVPKTVKADVFPSAAEIARSIAFNLSTGFFQFCYEIASLFGSLFVEVVSLLIKSDKWTITNGQGKAAIFTVGWATTRDFANMLIVLAIIGIAVATILRFKDYEAKKLLLPIIVVALLINFSNVFVGIFIDTSNIVMTTWTDGADQEKSLVDTVFSARQAALAARGARIESGYKLGVLGQVDIAHLGKVSTGDLVAIMVMFGVIELIVGLVLLYVSILLFVRYAILALLFILAPLAFVLRVVPVPDAKKLWTSWWEHFIKWCFIGVGVCFFLHLSVEMITRITKDGGFAAIDTTTTVFNLAVVLLILLVGVKISTKSAQGVAGMAIGLATAAVVGVATGGVSLLGSAAGGAAKALGSTKAGNYVKEKASAAYGGTKDWFTRRGEDIGLRTRGQANLNQQKRAAERMKPFEQYAEAEKDNDVVAKRAMTSNNAAERAAYTQVLQKRKKLDKIKIEGKTPQETEEKTRQARQQAVDNAKNHGIDTTEFAKTDYRYAEFDDKAVKKVYDTRVASDPAFAQIAKQNPAQAMRIARKQTGRQQLEENLSSMSRGQRQNIDVNDLTPELMTSRNMTANMIRDFKGADSPQINKIRSDAVENEIIRQIIAAKHPKTGNKAELNRLRNAQKEISNLPHVATPSGSTNQETPNRGAGGGEPTGTEGYAPPVPPPTPNLPPIPLQNLGPRERAQQRQRDLHPEWFDDSGKPIHGKPDEYGPE